MPSLQLGLLQSTLNRAGFPTLTASLALTFLDFCCTQTAGLPPESRITLGDYDTLVSQRDYGIGDWVFSVPPFRDNPAADARYVAFLESQDLPEKCLSATLMMRRLAPAFLSHAADEVLATGARIIGFTSTFSQTVPSLVLAKMLKQRDAGLTILFGGANCDGVMGETLHRSFPWVDVVVRGEAELILPKVVEDLLAGRPVRHQPGLCIREAGQSISLPQHSGSVPMDDIPTPNFDEYFERLGATSFAPELEPVGLVYESSRGCWWGAKAHCTFCGLNGTSMAYRSKSPGRVLDELTSLATRYRRLNIDVVDNILDLRYLRDVLPHLQARGFDLSVYYATKANLKREQVHLLKSAGVDRIQPGIESLSTTILDLMRKGVTAFQNVRLLKYCAEYGIRPYWNVLYGFPGEPPEEYARMADVVPSLTHFWPPVLGILELSRFSPYHERAQELGLEITGPWPWYRYVYDLDEATLMDLAYAFEYRHLDGRDPATYVGPLQCAIETWRGASLTSYGGLRYHGGRTTS